MSSTFIDTLAGLQNTLNGYGSRRSSMGVAVPRAAVPVTVFGQVVVPAAYGTQALIAQFTCKANYYAAFHGLVVGWSGTGQAPGPGDILFSVDIDRPLGAINTGYPERDYGAVPFSLGSLVPGDPWPVDFRHHNGEVIRIKATAVANVGIGVGNFFTASLLGQTWPQDGSEGF